jgi:RNA polymerase sigma-70 factor (ECF subfamily)
VKGCSPDSWRVIANCPILCCFEPWTLSWQTASPGFRQPVSWPRNLVRESRHEQGALLAAFQGCKIAAVEATQQQHLEPDQPESPSGTLGDVLYARKSKALESEQTWASLVQSIAVGDQLALQALYERTHRLVFTLIVRIASNRETAEELTLDVFHDVWRRAARYDAANGTVLGWIMNQARSRAIDRLRFEQRQKRVEPDAGGPLPEMEAGECHAVLELKERARALRNALAVLAPDERQAIEAAFFSELTHAEVAARLNQPLGTVKTRIRSGLHKLRQALNAGAN